MQIKDMGVTALKARERRRRRGSEWGGEVLDD